MNAQPHDTVRFRLVEAIRRASDFNDNDQAPSEVILWPDHTREWGPVIETIREDLPVLTLGEFDPIRSAGPAAWIRCAVARTLPDSPPSGLPVVVYLPGVRREDLRAVEDCPAQLRLLAELQYRGVFFDNRARRDLTIAAFLRSQTGGGGIEVAPGVATQAALVAALPELLGQPVSTLERRAPLTSNYLNGLIVDDAPREILAWLDDPEGFRRHCDTAHWSAFASMLRDEYGVHPSKDGPVGAAQRLGAGGGSWTAVWRRFADAPERAPNVAERLDEARQASLLIEANPLRWPQDNDYAEDELRKALAAVADQNEPSARAMIASLADLHESRADSVWAALGRAPLALAVAQLKVVTTTTAADVPKAAVEDMAQWHATVGWRADDAALRAVAATDTQVDRAAVLSALRAVYRPWLDNLAKRFQTAVAASPTPGIAVPDARTCIVFVDGLRLDLARRLEAVLVRQAFMVESRIRMAPIPTLTPTGKPAATPIAAVFEPGDAFGVRDSASGRACSADVLRSALMREGITPLGDDESESGTSGMAWVETGAIDGLGHSQGWDLAHHVESQIFRIAERVAGLCQSGWGTVLVTTDHGWLLVPGGLPKVVLAESATEERKGRAARLRDTAAPAGIIERPWSWDPSVRIGLASGIGCFIAGQDYEHGGLSPQESVILELIVRPTSIPVRTTIVETRWRGLRLDVEIEGLAATADLRSNANIPESSLLDSTAKVDAQRARIFVTSGEPGMSAVLVLCDEAGRVLTQRAVIVGEDA